jgi:hypothetical protein
VHPTGNRAEVNDSPKTGPAKRDSAGGTRDASHRLFAGVSCKSGCWSGRWCWARAPGAGEQCLVALLDQKRVGRELDVVDDHDPAAAQAFALHEAQRDGARGNAQLLVGEPCELGRLLARKAGPLLNRRGNGARLREIARHPCGAVDLVLLGATLLPAEQRQTRRRHRWTPAASGDQLLSACAALLRPGGFLVLGAPTAPPDAAGTDLVSELVRVGHSHGLQYWQHVIVLRAQIENGQLHPAGTASRTRRHGDLLAFRKPEAADEQHGRRNVDARWAA